MCSLSSIGQLASVKSPRAELNRWPATTDLPSNTPWSTTKHKTLAKLEVLLKVIFDSLIHLYWAFASTENRKRKYFN